jgi:exosortase
MGAVLAAHAPLGVEHLGHLWAREHYRFLPLLLGVVLWLLWRRRGTLRGLPYVRGIGLEAVLMSLTLAALLAAIWLGSPYVAAVSAVWAFAFLTVHLVGLRGIEWCIGPWVLTWLLIPLPLGYDRLLISHLQETTSQVASRTLDLLGIDHLMAGHVLHLPGTAFFVDEACSGIHSLFALMGYTVLLAVAMSRGVRRGVLLLAASILWAMLANVLRVVSIALAYQEWGLNLASGWAHEVLGLVTFAAALGLTLSTDQLLHFLGYTLTSSWMWATGAMGFVGSDSAYRYRYRYRLGRLKAGTSAEAEAARASDDSHASGKRESLERSQDTHAADAAVPVTPRVQTPIRRSPTLGWTAATAYLALFLLQIPGLLASDRPGHRGALSVPLAADALPQVLAHLPQTNFVRTERPTAELGQMSFVWTYGASQQGVTLAVDADFSGWHELSECYRAQGWTVVRRTVTSAGSAESPEAASPGPGQHSPRELLAESDDRAGDEVAVEVMLRKPTGEHGFLVFGLYDGTGRPLAPPAAAGVHRLTDRLHPPRSLQMQAFVACDRPLLREECDRVRQMYREGVNCLRVQLARGNSPV